MGVRKSDCCSYKTRASYMRAKREILRLLPHYVVVSQRRVLIGITSTLTSDGGSYRSFAWASHRGKRGAWAGQCAASNLLPRLRLESFWCGLSILYYFSRKPLANRTKLFNIICSFSLSKGKNRSVRGWRAKCTLCSCVTIYTRLVFICKLVSGI